MIEKIVQGIIEYWLRGSILIGFTIIIWVDWLGRGKTKEDVLNE